MLPLVSSSSNSVLALVLKPHNADPGGLKSTQAQEASLTPPGFPGSSWLLLMRPRGCWRPLHTALISLMRKSQEGVPESPEKSQKDDQEDQGEVQKMEGVHPSFWALPWAPWPSFGLFPGLPGLPSGPGLPGTSSWDLLAFLLAFLWVLPCLPSGPGLPGNPAS